MDFPPERVQVPQDGSLFAGHFPGRPIVPGVAQIGWVLARRAAATGQAPVLAGIQSMRWRHLVLPGDELMLTVREDPSQGLRFDLRRQGARVSDGVLCPAGKDPQKAATREDAIEPLAGSLPLPSAGSTAALLPHQRPMRLLCRVLAWSAVGLDGEAEVEEGCGLREGGAIPGYAVLEAAAQAAAAWEALQRSAAQATSATPRLGYLVALRDVAFGAALPSGTSPMQVRVRLRDAALPLSRYDFAVSEGPRRLAWGQFATTLADGLIG
jgi:predicted hotdog family 3-hydroxylacyl-ACP dehydratase